MLKNWRVVVLTTLVFQLVYQPLIYLHPENQDWIGSEYFSLGNALSFIFIDQFLIECITVAIIFQLIRFYGNRLGLKSISLKTQSILIYELKFLPLLIMAFFAFGPITLTVRFLYHQLPNPDWDIYFSEYFYSTSLYLVYLAPVLVIGYIAINVNLISHYNRQLGETKHDLRRSTRNGLKTRLLAADDTGELFLDSEKIQWIERLERRTIANNGVERFRLKETISELEENLDANKFIRINRSTIVNLEFVANYSFWENDKYILRMKNYDQEFVMSRNRLNKIKDKFLK